MKNSVYILWSIISVANARNLRASIDTHTHTHLLFHFRSDSPIQRLERNRHCRIPSSWFLDEGENGIFPYLRGWNCIPRWFDKSHESVTGIGLPRIPLHPVRGLLCAYEKLIIPSHTADKRVGFENDNTGEPLRSFPVQLALVARGQPVVSPSAFSLSFEKSSRDALNFFVNLLRWQLVRGP